MTNYVVHLDRGREHVTSASVSAFGACEKIDESRGGGWSLRSILRNGFPIREDALRTDAIHEPRHV